jgi:hypothetical protein
MIFVIVRNFKVTTEAKREILPYIEILHRNLCMGGSTRYGFGTKLSAKSVLKQKIFRNKSHRKLAILCFFFYKIQFKYCISNFSQGGMLK